ncbi:MAG: phytanoyl-CoA dioxygenase family protein [Planctomycetota bacterium]
MLSAAKPTPAIAATMTIQPQQITHYQHQGYLAIPDGVAPATELPMLREIYDRLFADRAGKDKGHHFALFGNEGRPDQPVVHQLLGPEFYAPELKHTVAWANARAILTAILGAEPVGMGGHAICKPPGSPLATPWHQDESYWDSNSYSMSASIWIPLQDVDDSSGCMQFIPGSHLGEILPHRPTNDDPRAQGLELAPGNWDLSNAISCPLRGGGCTVHGGKMLHYTGPNLAAVPRRAWVIMGSVEAPKRLIPAERPWIARMRAARALAAKDAKKF